MRSRGIYHKEEKCYTCENSALKQISSLTDTVFKLREESKLLRKAHQEVHSQLLSAQVIISGLFVATRDKPILGIETAGDSKLLQCPGQPTFTPPAIKMCLSLHFWPPDQTFKVAGNYHWSVPSQATLRPSQLPSYRPLPLTTWVNIS